MDAPPPHVLWSVIQLVSFSLIQPSEIINPLESNSFYADAMLQMLNFGGGPLAKFLHGY